MALHSVASLHMWAGYTLHSTHEAASDLRLLDKATKVFVVTSAASAEYCSLLLAEWRSTYRGRCAVAADNDR